MAQTVKVALFVRLEAKPGKPCCISSRTRPMAHLPKRLSHRQGG